MPHPYRWEDNVAGFDPARAYRLNIPLPADSDIFLGFLFSHVGSALTRNEYERDLREALDRDHTPVNLIYGEGQRHSYQVLPGGLAEFEHALEDFLRTTLESGFDVAPRWRGDAYVGLTP